MADDEATPTQRGEHPVLSGLIALVGVALVVGLVLGGGALAATKVLGLDDDGTATEGATSEDSLYLPRPSDTAEPSGPLVTLDPAPGGQGGGDKEPREPRETEPETAISLSAGQTAVSPMEQIDLTGVYPGGEGAILQVQRLEGGKWLDFPVTASVSNETFATYIQTSQTGPNKFRMIDTDTRVASNVIRVTIG